LTTKFDWRTLEDEEWEAESGSDQPPQPRRRSRLVIIILVLLLLAAGGAVYQQFQARNARVETAREADILASYYLLRGAVSGGDHEVFAALMEEPVSEWSETQRKLFDYGWIFDRQLMGFASSEDNYQVQEVYLDTENWSAEIVSEELISIYNFGVNTQTIHLEHSETLHWDEGWKWNQPAESFWGEQISVTAPSQHLVIDYPDRESAIVNRLVADLDTILGRFCIDLNNQLCADDQQVSVHLSHNSKDLLKVAEGFYRDGFAGIKLVSTSSGYEVTLPTPSLIGLPVDELGYQTLLKAYGAYLIGALFSVSVDPECCESNFILESALQLYLTEQNLLASPGSSGITSVTELPVSKYAVEVTCSNGFSQGLNRHRLDPDSDEWSLVDTHDKNSLVMAVPGGRGTMLQEMKPVEDKIHFQISWIQDGDQYHLFDRIISQRVAERVVWSVPERENKLIIRVPNENLGLGTYYTYDLDDCSGVNCDLSIIDLQGYPTWSPDGRSAIVRGYRLLWMLSGPELQELTQLGEGQAPFWIDETAFGFVRFNSGFSWEVVHTQLNDEALVAAFDSTDLQSLVASEDGPSRFSLAIILPRGESGSRWWVAAIGNSYREEGQKVYLFDYDMVSDSLSLISASEGLNGISLSPSSELLAGRIYDNNAHRWRYAIFSSEEGQRGVVDLSANGIASQSPSSKWSPDEKWLLIVEKGLLYFYKPVEEQRYVVEPPQAGCFQADWTVLHASPSMTNE
jgi:hypothetical protein